MYLWKARKDWPALEVDAVGRSVEERVEVKAERQRC